MTLALSDQESQLIRDQIQSNVSSLIYNTKSTNKFNLKNERNKSYLKNENKNS